LAVQSWLEENTEKHLQGPGSIVDKDEMAFAGITEEILEEQGRWDEHTRTLCRGTTSTRRA
jgi:hypothetical protein